VQSRLRDDISVKDFGAVGNGVADDTAAIQAAIDYAASVSVAGACVYFPKGNYFVTNTLTLTSANIWLKGSNTGVNHNTGGSVAQDGPTQIIGGHVTGPVVRIRTFGCRVSDLVISSNATRRAATAGANVYGILAEAEDSTSANSGNSPWRTTIDHVHVTKQPSHGIVIIGNVVNTAVTFTDIDNCNGHGIVVDNGKITGRVNRTRPGQVNLFSMRISRNDGSALYIGNTDDGVNNLPYRICGDMLECFFNLRNTAVYNPDGKQGELSGFIESCLFVNCAFAGYPLPPSTSTHNGLYVRGASNIFQNTRFINCEPYAAYVDNFVSYVTTDITFKTAYIVNDDQPPGYYNPAIYVDPACRNVKAHIDTYFSEVTTLMSLTSLSAEVNFKTKKYFNGETISSFNSTYAPQSSADDTAFYATFSGTIAYGVAIIGSNTNSAGSAVVAFRCGDGNAYCNILSSSGPPVTGTTGPLTGTTGTDTHLTVSADTATNRLYIENRTGGTRVYQVTFLSLSQPVQSFTNV
jgi:hypothetical protein